MCEVQNSVTPETPVDIEQSWFSIVKNVTRIVTHAGIIIGILKYYSSAQSKLCLLFSVLFYYMHIMHFIPLHQMDYWKSKLVPVFAL